MTATTVALTIDELFVRIDEALQRTDSSRRGAAKLLSVTRQALQHMIRRRS